jgi:hypothetical protein
MKIIISLLVLLALANANVEWIGSWNVTGGCDDGCCCPNGESIITIAADPSNSSQLLMTGTWNNNAVCSRINLKQGDAWPLPWTSSNTDFNPSPVYDGKGFEYWGYVEDLFNTTIGVLEIDELSQGGNPFCGLELQAATSTVVVTI